MEETRKKIAEAVDERHKKHYEEHLTILQEDKIVEEKERRLKKSAWMTDYRISRMSDDDIRRMFKRYREEMSKRHMEIDGRYKKTQDSLLRLFPVTKTDDDLPAASGTGGRFSWTRHCGNEESKILGRQVISGCLNSLFR